MNRQGLEFGDKVTIFTKGLFIGSERTFKGYAILFSIYSVAMLMAGMIINLLTHVHN